MAGATPLDQHPNRPSAIPGYESDLKQRVLPDLGTRRISSSDVRRLVTRLQGEGLAARASEHHQHGGYPPTGTMRRNNPSRHRKLPEANGKRQRVLSVARGAALPKALPETDRALWATALFHAFDAFLARQVG